MILLNFFIGFFALFITPQIFLYYNYKDIKYSLVLIYGLIASFSISWILFLIIFYFKLPNIFIYGISIFLSVSSLVYMYKKERKDVADNDNRHCLIWILTIIGMMPILLHIGDGFWTWDAITSWNRWALELYKNEYHPINGAYPILLPSLWSLIYKIQGTSEIWWTAQITIFVIPLMTLAILLTLYTESKNKAFIFMAIFIYPYLIWKNTIGGYMDMPVMLLGTLSLIMLYAAEINKDKYEFTSYVYAAILIAGIASITKQAGFVFLLFNFIYILLNLKLFKNKKKLIQISIFSLLYFVTFLTIYYQYQQHITGNLDHLQKLSSERNFADQDMIQTFKYLWNSFFSYPPYIRWITPLLIAIGVSLFIFKDLRKYNSVGFLSGIFFFIGLLVWIRYFSYDPRNSYWVKGFFIIFLSINLNYIIEKYAKKNYSARLKYIIVFIEKYAKKYYSARLKYIIIFMVGAFLYILGNEFAYKKQEKSQSKIGDPNLARTIVELLKDKDVCTMVYTNNLPMKHNYYTRKIKDRIIVHGEIGERNVEDVSTYHSYIKHTCKDGRYFLFGAGSWTVTRKDPVGWGKIKELEESGKIVPVGAKADLIYFIPPTHIKEK